MPTIVQLQPQALRKIRCVDARLLSYNIEMTEITGGTFWRAYTPGQIAGTESFPPIKGWDNLAGMMQVYPPIDLYDPKLRALAMALGPVWVRVSGGWANDTYYDFDGHTGGTPPAGYKSVLTKAQWTGVLDFVKSVGGNLLTSMAVPGGRWVPEQAKLLFDFSRDYGVPIAAVEYVNEPNVLGLGGNLPENFPDVFARDQDDFIRFVRQNYPGTLLIGPCACSDMQVGIQVAAIPTTELLAGSTERLDVFSYHYYNGSSERIAAMGGHWPSGEALSEEYLAMAGKICQSYIDLRDRYVPGGQMWVTESGDAGGGGNTWASTCLDVPRTLNELGTFATMTDGVIFHNTLASSDYGFLQHGTFEPRPNYFAALLWNQLMGTTVYDAGPVTKGAHVFAHSRRDGKDGVAYLVINNSESEATTVVLPCPATRYTLQGETLRAPVLCLNGQPLVTGADGSLPLLEPVAESSGTIMLPPASSTFLIL